MRTFLAQTLPCDEHGAVCERLYDWTGSALISEAADRMVGPALRVVLVIVVASFLLVLIRRVIHRSVERAKAGGPGSRLRGLVSDTSIPVNPRKAQRVDALGAVVLSIGTVVVWSLAAMTVLGSFGLELAPMIAGAGVVGLALGFGAQNLVRDFLSGMFMLAEDQFGIGDVVDLGEAVGVVEGMSLRTTRIRDVNGSLWHVPNGEIHRVANMSQEWARTLLDVGVAYDTDIDQAAATILAAARALAADDGFAENFLDEPEILGVQELGADSVDIRVVIKTRPGVQWAMARELRRRIKYALDDAHIEIPFPQRTMWLRTDMSDTGTPLTDVVTGQTDGEVVVE
jgi:moderate conductance mechanosensitive channel